MAHTFEELIGSEIDRAYRGALFLSGGEGAEAERLLTSTVLDSFRCYQRGPRPPEPDFPSWIQQRLVRRFLNGLPDDGVRAGAETIPPGEGEPDVAPDDAPELLQAVGRLPARARAAIWLVLLRRMSYAQAAEVLGVDRGHLVALLGHRATLFQAIESDGEMGASGSSEDGLGT